MIKLIDLLGGRDKILDIHRCNQKSGGINESQLFQLRFDTLDKYELF